MTIISCMFPEIWSARYIIYNHFGPFFALLPPPPSSLPPNNPKSWNFENNEKKNPLRDTKNHDHILPCSWDTARDECNLYFYFWAILCRFNYPCPLPNKPKTQNIEKMKKSSENIIILHMCTKSWYRGGIVRDRQTDGRTDGR